MPTDLGGLIRADHDDLDRALLALIDAASSDESALLVDALHVGLGAHAAAERVVLRDLLGPVASSRLISGLVENLVDEHCRHATMLASLGSLRRGSTEWTASILELRVAILDHAAREELVGTTLLGHVAPARRRALASEYATERLRRLACD
jgi:hypothetical protein